MSESMDRNEYLLRLKQALSGTDPDEATRVLTYYQEMIDDRVEDGLDEKQAVATLEAPEEVARMVDSPRKMASEDVDEPVKRVVRLSADEVSRIRIRVRNQSVDVLPSEDGQVHLIYFEFPDCPAVLTHENGVLRLVNDDDFSINRVFFKHLRFSRLLKNMSVTLRLPSRMAADIRVTTSNSHITVEQMAFAGAIDLMTSNSKIDLKRVMTQEGIKLVTGNASICLEDVRAAGELRAKSSNGHVGATRVAAAQFEAITSNSRVDLNNVKADDTLIAKSSNGRIGFECVDAADCTFITSNGNISGTMARSREAYLCERTTSNGKCDMPKGGESGATPLRARTSNGNIHIMFA